MKDFKEFLDKCLKLGGIEKTWTSAEVILDSLTIMVNVEDPLVSIAADVVLRSCKKGLAQFIQQQPPSVGLYIAEKLKTKRPLNNSPQNVEEIQKHLSKLEDVLKAKQNAPNN